MVLPNKGGVIINTVLLVFLAIFVGIVTDFVIFTATHKENNQQLPSPSASVKPTASPSPSTDNKSNTFKLLDKAWNDTTVYANPKLDITFEYPSYFEVNPITTNKDYVSVSVRVPWANYSDLETHMSLYCQNNMYVSVIKYDNSKRLSLYDFIAELNKSYGGGGVTATFDDYKKGLTRTALPQPNSYMFKGIESENPVEEVYFDHNSAVYKFYLMGGCGTGDEYSKDAEAIFQNMVKSVRFE